MSWKPKIISQQLNPNKYCGPITSLSHLHPSVAKPLRLVLGFGIVLANKIHKRFQTENNRFKSPWRTCVSLSSGRSRRILWNQPATDSLARSSQCCKMENRAQDHRRLMLLLYLFNTGEAACWPRIHSRGLSSIGLYCVSWRIFGCLVPISTQKLWISGWSQIKCT